MTYSSRMYMLMTILVSAKVPSGDGNSGPAALPLQDTLQPAVQQILDLAASFRTAAVSPEATLEFERQVQQRLREIGRVVLEHTYNAVETDDVQTLPKHVRF